MNIIIIGAGPAGYVAAIRAAQLGMQVTLIEKRKTLGGTCLNVGCIPSKALLDSSEHYHQAKKKFGRHGIQVGDLTLDFTAMMARKTGVVDATISGIDYLMKKWNIKTVYGTGKLTGPTTVAVSGDKDDDTTILTADAILIATGSEPIALPTVPFDGTRVISSTEALSLPELPKTLVVIGGGVIGVELASVYARLGTQVRIIEYADRLIAGLDKDLSIGLQKSLKKLGIQMQFKTAVTGCSVSNNSVIVQTESESFEGDHALVCIGRKPYTADLGLETVGIPVDSRGRITVNQQYQTPVPSIYAIGDVISGDAWGHKAYMLAHQASEEGVACVEMLAGQSPHVNYHAIPNVVYTWPEVASVGFKESEITRPYKTGTFPFKASGRARAADELDGFIKVLSDKETDEILGIHMIGPRVADLIHSAVTALEYKASAEDIARLCAPHPTFSEALKEACLDATDARPLHY